MGGPPLEKGYAELENENSALREEIKRLETEIAKLTKMLLENIAKKIGGDDSERLARLVDKLQYYHMVLSVESAPFLIELSANMAQAIADTKKQ